jgi:DNA polymerase III delta prime subunit
LTSNHFDIARGQVRAWTVLARAHAAGRVASTYLLYGPEGVGAWALAIEFAALLNCESPLGSSDQPESRRPCGACQPCRSTFGLNFEGLHLLAPIPPYKVSGDDNGGGDDNTAVATSKKKDRDLIELTNEVIEQKRREPFSLLDRTRQVSIPIELAREVKKHLAIRARTGITRVVLFYQMETMRVASADALLKMIEEPPADTVIILTAVQPEHLLPTILSRAQKVRLDPLPEAMIVDYLKERYAVPEQRALQLSRVCERSLGRAIAEASAAEGEETDLRPVALMMFKTLLTEPVTEVAAQMAELLNFRDRGAAENLIRHWQSFVRDCAYLSGTSDETNLVNVDFQAEIRAWAPRFSDPAVVEHIVNTTKNTLADLTLNVHIQPALVAMALKLKADLEAGRANGPVGK